MTPTVWCMECGSPMPWRPDTPALCGGCAAKSLARVGLSLIALLLVVAVSVVVGTWGAP